MKCADYIQPSKIAFRNDATDPVAAEGEVLVRVSACGICGSDLHMFRNDSYRDHLVRHTPDGYSVPGHEFAGTIAALGEGVSGWSVGERVVGVTGMGGGMAELVAVPVNPFQLVRIPDGVSDAEAATTEPMADGLQMVRKAELSAGEAVVVFGVGIIGLGVIQAIRARGIDVAAIIAVDVHKARLDKALEIGATHAVSAMDGDVFDQVSAITGIEDGYRGRSARIDAVFDCAGYIAHMKGPPPLETALKLVSSRGGRIICFGGFEGAMTIDLGPIIQKEPVIMGSNGYAAEELVEALDLMQRGAIDRRCLITESCMIEQISEAFSIQMQADQVKVMVKI